MDNYGDPAPSPGKHGATVRGDSSSSSSSNYSSTSSMFNPNSPNYALNGKIMLCSVIVLFAALVLILGFHTYARWLFRCCRRRSSRLPLRRVVASVASHQDDGLDVSVLKSLPTFTFHAGGENGDSIGDCSICLSEFKDGESGRALPKCGHAFHVECIDMWFQSHSSCPLCRALVQARPDSNSPTTMPTAISLPRQGNESTANSGMNGTPPDDLVVITVEASPSMEEIGSGSGEGDQAKSLVNRFCL